MAPRALGFEIRGSIRDHMNRAYLLIACCCLPLAAGPAPARDLWGLDSVILTDEATPVLVRTERRSPAAPGRPTTQAQRDEFAYGPPAPPTPVPGGGQIITAPPIPGLGAGESAENVEPTYIEPDAVASESELATDLAYGPPADGLYEPALRDIYAEPLIDPQTDEAVAEIEPEPATDDPFHLPASAYVGPGPDISGVEIFVPEGLASAPEDNTSEAAETISAEGEMEMASAAEPRNIIPPYVITEEPEEPSRPPQQFDSTAYTGYFTGVGIADGMQLQIYLSGQAITGSFVDRRGQTFRIDGQLAEEEGRAQAMVISSGAPIGYMNLQLTNLGLTSLFVPLDENLTPQSASARQYEFLRTLSPAARSRLEAERAAREATMGDGRTPEYRRPTFPESEEEGLQEVFPGDVDGDE